MKKMFHPSILKNAFAIDARSIRLFRILLGVAILFYVVELWPVIDLFFTENGILTAEFQRTAVSNVARGAFSIFYLSDTYGFAASMLVLLAISGFALVAGKAPRIWSAVAAIILISISNRFYQASYGADQMIRLLAFWSIFLPARGGANAGTFAALAQLATVYAFAGFIKSDRVWLIEANGVIHAFKLDHFTRSWTAWTMNFPGTLRFSSIVVLLLERFGWLLFFSPWRTGLCRFLAFVSFAGLHLVIIGFLHIGLFPYLNLIFLTLLLPAGFWETMEKFGIKYLRADAKPEEDRLLNGLAAAFSLLVLVWNLSVYARANWTRSIPVNQFMASIGLRQHWAFYGPAPNRNDGWHVFIGQLADGTEIDVLRNKPVSFLKPPSLIESFPHRRWGHFLTKMTYHRHDPELLDRTMEYFCKNDDRIRRIETYYVLEETMDVGEVDRLSRKWLMSRNCY